MADVARTTTRIVNLIAFVVYVEFSGFLLIMVINDLNRQAYDYGLLAQIALPLGGASVLVFLLLPQRVRAWCIIVPVSSLFLISLYGALLSAEVNLRDWIKVGAFGVLAVVVVSKNLASRDD